MRAWPVSAFLCLSATLLVRSGLTAAPPTEVVVAVAPATGCSEPPAAPTGLSASVTGAVIALAWAAPIGCTATSYVVYAGSSPGAANLAVVPVGNVLQFSGTAPPGTYYLFVVAQNAFGASAPSNIVTALIGSPSPPPTPAGPSSFGPGQWRTHTQLAPGRYYAAPRSGCYWERQRGVSGAVPDIIANEFIGFDATQWIVDIHATDAGFETDPQCGTWFSAPFLGDQATIRPGVWLVGAQLPAGTYRTMAASGCYWARLRNFTSELGGIIDNEFASGGGQQIVTLVAGDVGFETDADCGTWTRVPAALEPHREPFPTSDELLFRWMLNQEQETTRHPSPRGRRAADAAPR
jgi:hypothetical protein